MAFTKSRKSKPFSKSRKSGAESRIGKLSTSEILSGVLLFADKSGIRFSEQDVYRFFRELERKHPALEGRFRVRGIPPYQSSPPLRQALSFFAMGKILEVPQPNPVVQYFHARSSQLESLRRNLEARRVLPSETALLQSLAGQFRQSLVPRPVSTQ